MEADGVERAWQVERRHVDVMNQLVEKRSKKRPRPHNLSVGRREHPDPNLATPIFVESVETVKLAGRKPGPRLQHANAGRRPGVNPLLAKPTADLLGERLRRLSRGADVSAGKSAHQTVGYPRELGGRLEGELPEPV